MMLRLVRMGQEKKKDEIPQTNETTWGVNKLLLDRIKENEYFQSLMHVHSFQELTDEVQRRVTHVEPWSAGTSRIPSTAWCILVKYFVLRLTVKQVHSLIRRRGSPYVRAMGFLYLRMVTAPKSLWDWMEEFIDDGEEFAPGANPDITMSMGRFLMKILTDMKFYDTMLPRIPVPIERKIKAYMILAEDEQRRAESNMRILGLLRPGAVVQAIYKDDENDPAFYEATINELVDPDVEGGKPKVVVTFNEYGNEECLALGKVMLPDAVDPLIAEQQEEGQVREDSRRRSRSRDRDRGDRRRSRSRSRDRDRKRRSPPASSGGTGSLMDSVMSKVKERDADKSAAVGKDYAQRPASYKGSLSLKLDRFTHRKKSRSRSPDRRGGGGGGSSRTEDGRRRDKFDESMSAREHRRERDREAAAKSGVYESGGSRPRERDDARERYLKERY